MFYLISAIANKKGNIYSFNSLLLNWKLTSDDVSWLQMENGILLPTLQSALPFLDLHGTPRLEFHQSVFDELRDKLMERVAFIAEGKDEDRCVMFWF